MVVISARYAMDRYATGRYEASRNDLRSILKKDCTMGLRRILLAASEQFQAVKIYSKDTLIVKHPRFICVKKNETSTDMDSLRKLLPSICNNVSRFLSHPNANLLFTRASSHLMVRTMQPSLVQKTQQLLVPQVPIFVPSCGMKVVGKLKKRCKDCYFVVRNERTYVICKTKPRHKQMSMKKKEEKSWILTYASQGPKREW